MNLSSKNTISKGHGGNSGLSAGRSSAKYEKASTAQCIAQELKKKEKLRGTQTTDNT